MKAGMKVKMRKNKKGRVGENETKDTATERIKKGSHRHQHWETIQRLGEV